MGAVKDGERCVYTLDLGLEKGGGKGEGEILGKLR